MKKPENKRFTAEQKHKLNEFAKIGKQMLMNRLNNTDITIETTEYKPSAVRKASRVPSTEKATQKSCMQFLSDKGIFYYRQNSGTFQGSGGGFYQMGVSGAPDIVIVYHGRFIGVEVKDKKLSAKQSPSQVKFQADLERAGGTYLLIRDVEELKSFFENI